MNYEEVLTTRLEDVAKIARPSGDEWHLVVLAPEPEMEAERQHVELVNDGDTIDDESGASHSDMVYSDDVR